MGRREHRKASEVYVDVIFEYPESDEIWKGSVPIEYRRTGIFARSDQEIQKVINDAYSVMNPEKRRKWLEEQKEFWNREKSHAEVTRSFFDALSDFKWKCVSCQLPSNPNPSRRIQDIKQMGYTVATHTRKPCEKCGKTTTHWVLLALPRMRVTGYERVTPSLRKRIREVLGNHDAYENRERKHLIPDHKFPEVRWGEEAPESVPEDITDEEIRRKFQLLDNQRNEQKREICRKCFQTGRRGTPFGINFFYEGDENWPDDVPPQGEEAEAGCIGCGWYDLDRWRHELNRELS